MITFDQYVRFDLYVLGFHRGIDVKTYNSRPGNGTRIARWKDLYDEIDRDEMIEGNKPIIRSEAQEFINIPMGYSLNGSYQEVLGNNPIMTDFLSECQAIIVLGCAEDDSIEHIGFTHVPGGGGDVVNWVHLMNNMNNCHQRFVIIQVKGENRDSIALDTRWNEYAVPNENILLVRFPDITTKFGINSRGLIGELVEEGQGKKRDAEKHLIDKIKDDGCFTLGSTNQFMITFGKRVKQNHSTAKFLSSLENGGTAHADKSN